jgi:hypothetical protein
VARRLAPILADILPHMPKISSMKEFEALDEDRKFDLLAKLAPPFMNGLAKLSNADSEEVLHTLLSCVQVKQAAGNWANVSVGGTLMFQDMDLAAMMRLAAQSFVFNLSGFFAALPQ